MDAPDVRHSCGKCVHAWHGHRGCLHLASSVLSLVVIFVASLLDCAWVIGDLFATVVDLMHASSHWVCTLFNF